MKKTCRSCGLTKSEPGNCVPCARARRARWIAKNPEKMREARKKWLMKNPGKVREYRQRTYAINRENINLRQREKRARNPEQACQRNRARYASNIERSRELTRESSRRWRAKNAEKHREMSKSWYTRNVKQHYEYVKKWRAENVETARKIGQRAAIKRYANKLNAPGRGVEQAQLDLILASYGSQCAYCQHSLQGGHHWDHVLPLSRGGPHDPINLVPACAWCNRSKGAEIWIPGKPLFQAMYNKACGGVF